MTFAEKAIHFNEQIRYTGGPLPTGITAVNPYKENPATLETSRTFYKKFYDDQMPRHLILGANPSNRGTCLTGIPFTDPKRLINACGIPYYGKITSELPSAYIYEMIEAYGGVHKFYGDFYINSPCPVGLTSFDAGGREKSYKYYDDRLLEAVEDYAISNIKTYISMGVNTDKCFCFGTAKNKAYLDKLNKKYCFFEDIILLDHQRFIMQYMSLHSNLYMIDNI